MLAGRFSPRSRFATYVSYIPHVTADAARRLRSQIRGAIPRLDADLIGNVARQTGECAAETAADLGVVAAPSTASD